ncbi:unnamed protein product [Linum tenue]|uniref:Amino acid permease/ SLC12A domain-containing protein n=1 Tax=Linum tenue TaxID=586396 RepID=A0AAV0JDD1_9ROSI|nr:unnamed protein product [Linum tenue]
MDTNNADDYSPIGSPSSPKLNNYRKVSILPLVFLIFYEVSGGPFGVEDSVNAAGPLLAILGFLIFPLVWSIPEALITAELGTMFPENAIPSLEDGFIRMVAVLVLTFMLTLLNYRGLTIVGWAAILLGVISLLPFLIMGVIAFPKLEPSRWLVVDFSKNPGKTLPKSLFYALILTVFSYLIPLLVGTGALPLDQDHWTDGYFSEIAKVLGGVWLMYWVQAASAVSNMGMFIAEMSSDSFQLLGMAERGMLPKFFSKRSRYGTPSIGILFSASGVNFLYCIGMIMEFVAFIKLRIDYPGATRPYKVPLGTGGAVVMCVLPGLLLVVVLVIAPLKVMAVSAAAIVVGLVMYPSLQYAERKNWLRFSKNSEHVDLHSSLTSV